MVFQANLAGTAIGVAYLDMVRFYLWTQLAKAVLVQLREGKATVTGKSATAHALWQEHIVRAHFGKGYHILIDTHQTR